MSKTDGENNRPVESLEENPEELPVELTEQEELPEEQTAQEELSAEQSEQEELPEEPTADSDTSAEEEPDPAPVDKEALKVVTHPTRRFEYVVPKETFQQHIRSKHRTTVHSGTTKMVTDEELEEASLGYVFSRSRRRKHHRSWWRRRPLWQRVLIILTAVDRVCINFNKPDQQELAEMTLADCEKYIAEGQFAPGSMLPKVQSCMEFVRDSAVGCTALITSLSRAAEALEGKTGTVICK